MDQPTTTAPGTGHRVEIRPGVYAELHEIPALLLDLEDERDRSRKREAFWASVVVHLMLLIALILLPKYMPSRPTVAMVPLEPIEQKTELTYLELPKDVQQLIEKPKTSTLSDKDRIAQSREPKIEFEPQPPAGSARPGAPGEPRPQPRPQQQQQVAQQTPQQQAGDAQEVPRNQVAALQPPPMAPSPRGNISLQAPMTAGSAIEQAMRASADKSKELGDRGSFGFKMSPQSSAKGAIDILSDTMGVDFGPYIERVRLSVGTNWYNLMPEVARPPLMKKGKVTIQLTILKNGEVTGLKLIQSSGDVALDRAAWGALTASNPLPELPRVFPGDFITLRAHFYYNPDRNDLR